MTHPLNPSALDRVKKAAEAFANATADRPTSVPGGCDCHACGQIFIGAEGHTLCGVCLAKEAFATPEVAREVAALLSSYEALQGENERLREALKPFADLVLNADPEDPVPTSGGVHCLIYGDGELGELDCEDFHAAAQALGPSHDQ